MSFRLKRRDSSGSDDDKKKVSSRVLPSRNSAADQRHPPASSFSGQLSSTNFHNTSKVFKQLTLPEGITCDVFMSSFISAGHFFLQQPSHMTYTGLRELDQAMTSSYCNVVSPEVPQPMRMFFLQVW